MIAETLLQHLDELNVRVDLTPDARALDLDAPRGIITPELADLLRANKSEMVELVYIREERAAIIECDAEAERRYVRARRAELRQRTMHEAQHEAQHVEESYPIIRSDGLVEYAPGKFF